jgi:hypothetical protein
MRYGDSNRSSRIGLEKVGHVPRGFSFGMPRSRPRGGCCSEDIYKLRSVNFILSVPCAQIPSIRCESALRTATEVLRLRRSSSSEFDAGGNPIATHLRSVRGFDNKSVP